MSDPLVVVDADVLGRRRTGDETYVRELLRALPAAGDGLRFAAITRRPDLVPDGVEPIVLPARIQELRMAVRVPLLLRRLRPSIAHFVHSLPPALPCPGVLTVQDVSFEHDASLMGRRETAIFRFVVPRSARKARRVLAISQRTKDDLVELYGLPPEKIVVTPLAPDPAFVPGGTRGDYLLFVGAIEARKNPLLAADAAEAAGRRLVVVGPERDRDLLARLRSRGADIRGFVEHDDLVRLYQEAAVLLFPTQYEGFGLPVAEAMACGTPVVATPDAAVREIGGDAVAYAEPGDFAATTARVLADPEPWARAGLERAAALSWEDTARRTVAVYREILG
jgi:glycosyltransferase involved in cell wall biosynthesis